MESPEVRRRTMQAVKSKNTAFELRIRRLLFRQGYRYRLYRKDLPGCPDIVFPSKRKVIFLHGCFWHGHTCKRGSRLPKTNIAYWTAKIGRNRERDSGVQKQLRGLGWATLVVWECQSASETEILKRLKRFLDKD